MSKIIYNIKPFGTIEELTLSTFDFVVGDIVDLQGYYEAGDGAHHKRKIEAEDDGSGVQLANGLWANIVHDGEVNVSWFGAKKNNALNLENSNYCGEINFIPKLNERLNSKMRIERISNKNFFRYSENHFTGDNSKKIYISSTSFSKDNKNVIDCITFSNFVENYNQKMYANEKALTLVILDNVVNCFKTIKLTIDAGQTIIIKSASSSGKTLITNGFSCSELTNSPTAVNGLKFLFRENCVATSLYDFELLDSYGLPKCYKKVGTVEELNSTEGTFYNHPSPDIPSVFVNPFSKSSEKSTKGLVVVTDIGEGIRFDLGMNSALILKDLIFANDGNKEWNGSVVFKGDSVSSVIILDDVTSLGGNGDSFSFNGVYSAFLNNCKGAYAGKDIFNYHTTDTDSVAVEVNCVGHSAGKFKKKLGNQGTYSNNATTAHDGMYIYRFGSKGFDCEGPVLADVNGCESVNYDCEMYSSTTETGSRSSFLISANGVSKESVCVLVNCKGGHKANKYTIDTDDTTKLYVNDFKGEIGQGGLKVDLNRFYYF